MTFEKELRLLKLIRHETAELDIDEMIERDVHRNIGKFAVDC